MKLNNRDRIDIAFIVIIIGLTVCFKKAGFDAWWMLIAFWGMFLAITIVIRLSFYFFNKDMKRRNRGWFKK